MSRLTGAATRAAFDPGGFGRIEIGRVCGQVSLGCASGFDRLRDASDFMRLEVIHEDDVACLQNRSEHLFDMGKEGSGDLQFHTGPATIDWRQAGVGARAALGLTGAGVVHVAMPRGDPRQRPADHRLVRLRLSRQGLSHLVMRLEATISDPTPLRAGVHGDAGAFFPGSRRVHLFNLCNHWTAKLLNAAGTPARGVLSGVADLLVGDLLWRAGGEAVPQARPQDAQAPAPQDRR